MSNWFSMQTGITRDDKRPASDFYETHPSLVEKLLKVEELRNRVWEPACGRGAISEVLKEHGYDVISSDLYDWGYGTVGVDFLKQQPSYEIGVNTIITNPPFYLSEQFAWHALNLGVQKVILFNRLAWLESKRRFKLFTKTPLKKVYVLSLRPPMMHRPDHEGPKIRSGTVAYAWYVWERYWNKPPELGWLL